MGRRKLTKEKTTKKKNKRFPELFSKTAQDWEGTGGQEKRGRKMRMEPKLYQWCSKQEKPRRARKRAGKTNKGGGELELIWAASAMLNQQRGRSRTTTEKRGKGEKKTGEGENHKTAEER